MGRLFLKLFLSAALVSAAWPGRERAFAPGADAYMAWLAGASPALYRALAAADPSRVFCGVKAASRAAALLSPAARAGAPARVLPSSMLPTDGARTWAVTEAAPRPSGPSFDVIVPPPRFFLP